MLGDLNQETSANGPVGTAVGRRALDSFLRDQRLVAVTGGELDPLQARGWRDSIDHICLDTASAVTADASRVWPEQFPLPGGAWPDHHGVEVSLSY
jgi:hypothetical protein